MEKTVHLLNQISQLSHTPRSGFAFLGTGQQSVAEHTYCATMICLALAGLVEEPINREKLLLLSLCHDLVEARTGDLNYVNKRYLNADNDKALGDLSFGTGVGDEIVECIREFDANETLESRLAHDADQIELLLVLKREYDTGNPRAMRWFDIVSKRVHTDAGKKLAEQIRDVASDAWWIADDQDPHWVHGGKE